MRTHLILRHGQHRELNIASVVLPKISHSSPEKRTYIHGANHIHYIADAPPKSVDPTSGSYPGLTYLVVAREDLSRKISFGFLLEIKSRLLTDNPRTEFSSLPAYGMAAFNAELGKLMLEYGTSTGGRQDAFRNVQSQIEDVRGIMTENIERVLERGERIDLLVDKTDRLGGSAQDFRYKSRNLRRQLWWKNVRLMAILVLVCILLLYLFLGAGCGFPAFGECF